jgi:hypothetical protein
MKFMFLISILIPSILTIITAAFRLCVGHEVREVGLETSNNAMIPPDPPASPLGAQNLVVMQKDC